MVFNRGTQNMDYAVLAGHKSNGPRAFTPRDHGSLYWNRVQPYGPRAYEGSDARLLEDYQIRGFIRPTIVYKKAAPANKPKSVYEQIHGAPKEAVEPKSKAARVPSTSGSKAARTPSAEKKIPAEKKKLAGSAKPSGVKNAVGAKKSLGVKDAGVKKTAAVKKNKVIPKKSAFLQVLEEVTSSSTT